MIDYIDTHAHIYEPEFDADRDEVMARAAAAGRSRSHISSDMISPAESTACALRLRIRRLVPEERESVMRPGTAITERL